MPMYTFKCPSCNFQKEVLQGMNDKSPNCDKCDDESHNSIEMERVYENIGRPKFKGSGFYETDYVKRKNRTMKATYNNERKKEAVIEQKHRMATKGIKEKPKPIPSHHITNMSPDKRFMDNTDPDRGPIIKLNEQRTKLKE